MLTLLYLLLILLGLTLLIGSYVLAYTIARKRVKNDSSKATILVKNGLETEAKKGQLSGIGKRGTKYFYGGKKVLFVPSSYQEVYHKNRRLLFIQRFGQLIASPFDNDIPLSDSEKEDLIYELTSGHIGADGLRAIKGKSSANVILIAIIAFIIGAVMVYGVVSYQDVIAKQQIQQQTQQQQDTNLPTPIEVK